MNSFKNAILQRRKSEQTEEYTPIIAEAKPAEVDKVQ